MKLTVAELAEILNGNFIGKGSTLLHGLSKIEEAREGEITFISNPKYMPWLNKTNASVIILNRNIEFENKNSKNLIFVDNSYLSFIKLLNKFSKKTIQHNGIHKNSSIHHSSDLGNNISVGQSSVIGPNCKIGDNVIIMDNVTIQESVSIGNDCVIYSGARIGYNTIIGDKCILHFNCVLGSDGFGFVPNDDNEYVKTPQIGNVRIGNNVEIGSNSSIDRATLGSTVIGDGVKIDNLVQIAHNVKIGNNTVIAGQCGIAGSTKVGKNCQIGGQVGIAGHLDIGNNVKINGGASVFRNAKNNSILRGSPAIDERNFNRSYVYFKNLEKIVKDINEIKKINDSND